MDWPEEEWYLSFRGRIGLAGLEMVYGIILTTIDFGRKENNRTGPE